MHHGRLLECHREGQTKTLPLRRRDFIMMVVVVVVVVVKVPRKW